MPACRRAIPSSAPPLSACRKSAVDRDRLAGHESRKIAGEIDREFADLFELARPRDRMHTALERDNFFPVRLQLGRLDRERRFDEARADRIDPDVSVSKIHRGGLHQADYAPLAGAIADPFLLAGQS